VNFLHRYNFKKDEVFNGWVTIYLCGMLKTDKRKFRWDFIVEPHMNGYKFIKEQFNEAKSHEKFFQLSPDMLCIVGFDGRFQHVSPGFERVLGYTKKEVTGRPFREFIIKDDEECSLAEMNAIKNGNPSLHFENRYRAKDGSIKWMAWRTLATEGEEHIYAVARDITAQKNAELELRARSEELNELIKHKNSGLRYGRLLQEAIFHDPETLNDIFTESFVFHKSKDIVSGDFYWFKKNGSKAYIACADATGHGVPGAIISVLGISQLHQIIGSKSLLTPSRILNKLNECVFRALSKTKQGRKKVTDGMDISVFSLDLKTKKLHYSGANNSLYIIRNGELLELKPNKCGIGTKRDTEYSNTSYQAEKGDMIYAFTDGFADQFGGEKGKKFMYKNFKNLLISISKMSGAEQKLILSEILKNWMGEHEQVDDICVVGVRI
jgi:PAS domain S-box-containing protein